MADQAKYIYRLRNSRVLIIGGTSGIGYAVAEACIEHSASTLILSSSNPKRIESSIQRLKSSYPKATSTTTTITGHVCNLSTESTLESSIHTLFNQTGPLDHIIYTAGDALAVTPITSADFTFSYIKKAGMLRFFAPMLVAKYGSSVLTPGPESSITLTTGAVSEHPIKDWTVVGSYATGLQGMCRQLALDLKPIRVNLISPGGVDTELWDGMMNEEKKREALENMAKGCATGRVARPEDVAEAYMYCMKDRNITGSMISTNGGHLIM